MTKSGSSHRGGSSKVLTKTQVEIVKSYLTGRRNEYRNRVIFLLSVRAGLRSCEISGLRWNDVLNSDGEIGDTVTIRRLVSKGGYSGREISLSKDLKASLIDLYTREFTNSEDYLVRSERGSQMSSQVIVTGKPLRRR